MYVTVTRFKYSAEFIIFFTDGYECVALNRNVELAKKVQVCGDSCARGTALCARGTALCIS